MDYERVKTLDKKTQHFSAGRSNALHTVLAENPEHKTR